MFPEKTQEQETALPFEADISVDLHGSRPIPTETDTNRRNVCKNPLQKKQPIMVTYHRT